MARKNKKTTLLAKYSELYKKNPKSRVFAPLAESYRKLGMLDEALEILRDGIKRHPDYVMGYVVLAHCYFDRENYEQAYSALRPFVAKNLENISLQKLFAQVCVNLGYLEEALQTFKYLLLLNPKDEHVSEQVRLLEDDLLVDEEAHQSFGESEIEGEGESGFGDDEDDWVQVNFNQASRREEDEEEFDEWNMENPEKKSLLAFKEEVAGDRLDVLEHELDDDYYHEEYDNEEEDPESFAQDEDGQPIITHTLVDLYERQGHRDKAIELLESILDLHPNDKPSLERLNRLKNEDARLEGTDSSESEVNDDLDLANLVEERVKDGEEKSRRAFENKLNMFLAKIKKEARLRQERS